MNILHSTGSTQERAFLIWMWMWICAVTNAKPPGLELFCGYFQGVTSVCSSSFRLISWLSRSHKSWGCNLISMHSWMITVSSWNWNSLEALGRIGLCYRIKGKVHHCSPQSHWLKLFLHCRVGMSSLREKFLIPLVRGMCHPAPVLKKRETDADRSSPTFFLSLGTSLRWWFSLNGSDRSHSHHTCLYEGESELAWVWAALAPTSWSSGGVFPRLCLYWWEMRLD